MHTVYKTTNLLDGKYYIGVHKTSDPLDSYMGSGVRLIRAIRKHGIANFQKTILIECEDAELAYFIESHLVSDAQVADSRCYNMKCGGSGGGTVGNRGYSGRSHTAETRAKLRSNSLGRRHTDATKLKMIRKKSDAERQQISQSLMGLAKSESHKRKISGSVTKSWTPERKTASSRRMSGSNNHQHGTFWITNGSSNAKSRGEIPDGWRRGMTVGT